MSLNGGPQDPYSTPQQPIGGVPVPPPPPPPYGGAPVAPAGYGAPVPGAGSYGAPPPMPPTGYGMMGGTEKNGLGVWALVLGILSFFCGGFLTGIPAIILGKKSQEAQALGQANNGNLGKIGAILGWIITVLSILMAIVWIILFATGKAHWTTTGITLDS